MTGALLGAQCVALAALVGVSAWGARHVPSDARIRVRTGPTGVDWTIGKTAALVSTPVAGALVVLGSFAVGDSPSHTTIAALGLAVIVVLLLAHRSSVRRAAG